GFHRAAWCRRIAPHDRESTAPAAPFRARWVGEDPRIESDGITPRPPETPHLVDSRSTPSVIGESVNPNCLTLTHEPTLHCGLLFSAQRKPSCLGHRRLLAPFL